MIDVKQAVPQAAPAPGEGWRIVWGVLLIVSGFLAVMMPEVAALATTVIFGWLLTFGGGCEVAYAVHTLAAGGFAWKLTSGILTLLLGVAILIFPLAGAASLGLLVGSFLFVGGIARTALALRLKPRLRWGWVLIDGLLSVALSILILSGWPHSSLTIIGLFTGFWLLWSGTCRITLR
jgi:uncharacterized membrane protein HdeD (DUF308 family)